MEHVTLLAALEAGALSFISPSVAALVPGYMSYISGVSLAGSTARDAGRPAASRLLGAAALAFGLGFSLVFIALGASTTAVGELVRTQQPLFARVGGGLVILAGFKALGVLPVDRLLPGRAAPATRTWARLATAFGLGIAFAFGWTPYVGPILTAILFVAGTEEMLGRGLVLLSVYSTGLVLSFLACALAVHVVCTSIAAVCRHRRTVELVAGTMLVVLGSLIFTGRLTLVTEQLTAYLPVF